MGVRQSAVRCVSVKLLAAVTAGTGDSEAERSEVAVQHCLSEPTPGTERPACARLTQSTWEPLIFSEQDALTFSLQKEV